MSNNHEGTVISFISGRHHGPEVWAYVRPDLEDKGYRTLAPDIPIESDDFDMDQHASILAQAEEDIGAKEVIRVGWSWGANIIPRAAGSAVIKRLVFIGGVFNDATIANHPNFDYFSRDHTGIYEIMERYINQKLKDDKLDEQDVEALDFTFYHDVEDKHLVRLIIGGLKPHDRDKRLPEPELKEFPDIPMSYIALKNDRATKLDVQRDNASALGLEPIPFESCHSPMLDKEKAKKLAGILINLAQGTQVPNRTPLPPIFARKEQISAYS